MQPDNQTLEVGYNPYPGIRRFNSHLEDFTYYELYCRNPWVRACIDITANRAVRDKFRVVDDFNPNNLEIADLEAFLDAPNSEDTFKELMGGVVEDLRIYGRAYLYIQETQGGKPYALWPMDTRITSPVTDGHGEIINHVQEYNGERVEFSPDEVLYFKRGKGPAGLSPMRTLLKSLAAELNAEEFNSRLFANNMNIGTVISLDNADDAEAQKTQEYLDAKFTTPENAHRGLVLRNGAKLVKDGAASVKDIAWEKLIEGSRQKACAVFGVPEFKLGISVNTNKSEGGEHDKTFWEETVLPLVTDILDTFNRQFVQKYYTSPGLRVAESLTNVVPSSAQLDAAMKVAQMGAQYNYIRRLLGMEPVPNGDYFVIWTAGGYLRLDKTSMPGIGNPDITPEDAEAELMDEQAAAQAPPDTEDTAPPEDTGAEDTAPEDAGGEPANVIDLTKSLETVERKDVAHPGSRGGVGFYDLQGRWHYGAGSAEAYNQKQQAKAQKKAEAEAKKAARKKAAEARTAARAAMAKARQDAAAKRRAQLAAERAANKAKREKEQAEKKAAQDKKRTEAEQARAAEKAKREAERQQRLAERKAHAAEVEARRQAREAERARRQAQRETEKAQREAERAQKQADAQKARADKLAAQQAAQTAHNQMQAATQELRDMASHLSTNPADAAATLHAAGWGLEGSPAATPEAARQAAAQLASANPDTAYAVVHTANGYSVVSKPLSRFGTSSGNNVAGGTVEGKPGKQPAAPASKPKNKPARDASGPPKAPPEPAPTGDKVNPKTARKAAYAPEWELLRAHSSPSYGTNGEKTHPHMSAQIHSTRAAFDKWAYAAWLDKVKALDNGTD